MRTRRETIRSGAGNPPQAWPAPAAPAVRTQSGWDRTGCCVRSAGWHWRCEERTLPPTGPSHASVDISEGPPAGAKRGRELNSRRISEGNEFERSLTLTVTSFFSSAFPSGNFSPKHMLMVYSGDPPLFSLNSFSSGHRQDAQQQQMRRTEVEGFFYTDAGNSTYHAHIWQSWAAPPYCYGAAYWAPDEPHWDRSCWHTRGTCPASWHRHRCPVPPGGGLSGCCWGCGWCSQSGNKGTEFKDDRYQQRDSPHTTTYLLVIQQTISRWETDVMVGF